jgi:LacI family transcriptional regulator
MIELIRPTLAQVAREAGLSLATVDRALNGRGGVHAKSKARVAAAVERLGYRRDPFAAGLARGATLRFIVIMPDGSNSFMAQLRAQFLSLRPWLSDRRAVLELRGTDVFSPDKLAAALDAIPEDCAGVAVVALDHPRVRAAIDDLAARGVPVVTVVSDAPASRRVRFVGIDNTAAGRTAATLLGRFAGKRRGTVGVIVGTLGLRDHAERFFGFTQILGAEHPHLAIAAPREGRDESTRTRIVTAEIVAATPDLVGIYCTGAGNRGIAAGLQAGPRKPRLLFIGHELTPHTRKFLLDGTMDAVINQDAGHEARSAARILLATATQEPILADQERIRIDIFLRDNLP